MFQMLDTSVGPPSAAPSERRFAAQRTPDAQPGEVVAAHASRVTAGPGAALAVDAAAGVEAPVAVLGTLTVGGCNIEAMLLLAETDRLRPGALTDSNFQPGSVLAPANFAGVVPVSSGGTGRSEPFAPGALLLGSGASALGQADLAGVDSTTSRLLLRSGAALVLEDPQNPEGTALAISASNGVLVASGSLAGEALRAVLASPSGPGVAPTLCNFAVAAAGETTADLAFRVADADGDASRLHVAAFVASSDFPRDPEEVAAAAGAISYSSRWLGGTADVSGTIAIDGLEPGARYTVRAVAEDARGNISFVASTTLLTDTGAVEWILAPEFVPDYREAAVRFRWHAPPNTKLYALLGVAARDAADVQALGEDLSASALSNPGLDFTTLTGPTGAPLAGAAEYVLSALLINPRNGKSNLASATGRTLDAAPPVWAEFAVSYSGSNPRVVYRAEDAAGIARAAILVLDAPAPDASPAALLAHPLALDVSAANPGDLVWPGVPAHCNAYVYGAAEDRAALFGAPANLTAVASAVQLAPAAAPPQPAFEQAPASLFVRTSADFLVTADSLAAAVDATLLLYPEDHPRATPQAAADADAQAAT